MRRLMAALRAVAAGLALAGALVWRRRGGGRRDEAHLDTERQGDGGGADTAEAAACRYVEAAIADLELRLAAVERKAGMPASLARH